MTEHRIVVSALKTGCYIFYLHNGKLVEIMLALVLDVMKCRDVKSMHVSNIQFFIDILTNLRLLISGVVVCEKRVLIKYSDTTS